MSNGKWMPPGYKVRVAFVLPDQKFRFSTAKQFSGAIWRPLSPLMGRNRAEF